jgi:hypothetical protein
MNRSTGGAKLAPRVRRKPATSSKSFIVPLAPLRAKISRSLFAISNLNNKPTLARSVLPSGSWVLDSTPGEKTMKQKHER